MNPYVLLIGAILFEVFGSSMMKASNGFKKLVPTVGLVIGMGSSFYLLSKALEHIPLGTAYAIWSGGVTALTAIVGILVWKEKFNLKILLGLLIIIAGVVVLKLSH
ncbi:TPA_asm: quaternary ammonium compound efflux SMR transporter BcrB [Listeria monocytogenes]|nr:quaternary ammonium compound efflux SMR transporter BcrB [Listeria monocytogenes]